MLKGIYMLNITIRAPHFAVTAAIENHIHKRLNRVLKHFDHVVRISVSLSVEKLRHRAEITLHMPHKDVHVEAETHDLYESIDAATHKLDRQVLRHKEGLRHHHHVVDKHFVSDIDERLAA